MLKPLAVLGVLIMCILFSPISILAAMSHGGYVHADPSKKGFIMEDGTKFIVNDLASFNWGSNTNLFEIIGRAYKDDPTTGREYVFNLGASGGSTCDIPTTPGLSYNDLFKAAAAVGINSVRAEWDGGEPTAKNSPTRLRLEPPPIGYYNILDTCISSGTISDFLDPSNIALSSQIKGSDFLATYPNCTILDNFANCGPYSTRFRHSMITYFVRAAENNNVHLRIDLFRGMETGENNTSTRAPIEQSAYYYANCIQGTTYCGFIHTYTDFYTDPNAIAFEKQRLKFIMQIWGASPAVWSWAIYNEINYSSGTDGTAKINWLKTIAAYLKQIDPHNRPVSFSSWESGTDPFGTKTNPAFADPNIDIVDYHSYNVPLVADRLTNMRAIESAYQKVSYNGEFYVWHEDGTGTQYTGLFVLPLMQQTPASEDPPYQPSLIHMFEQLIGTASNISGRWGGGLNNLATADYWTMAPLHIPITNFINQVNWQAWNYSTSAPWENNMTATNSDFRIARGDGDQVMALVHTSSATNSLIKISNLAAGNYTVSVFDYVTGTKKASSTMSAAELGSIGYSLNLANSFLSSGRDNYDRYQFAILLVENTNAQVSTISYYLTNWFNPYNSFDFAKLW